MPHTTGRAKRRSDSRSQLEAGLTNEACGTCGRDRFRTCLHKINCDDLTAALHTFFCNRKATNAQQVMPLILCSVHVRAQLAPKNLELERGIQAGHSAFINSTDTKLEVQLYVRFGQNQQLQILLSGWLMPASMSPCKLSYCAWGQCVSGSGPRGMWGPLVEGPAVLLSRNGLELDLGLLPCTAGETEMAADKSAGEGRQH